MKIKELYDYRYLFLSVSLLSLGLSILMILFVLGIQNELNNYCSFCMEYGIGTIRPELSKHYWFLKNTGNGLMKLFIIWFFSGVGFYGLFHYLDNYLEIKKDDKKISEMEIFK